MSQAPGVGVGGLPRSRRPRAGQGHELQASSVWGGLDASSALCATSGGPSQETGRRRARVTPPLGGALQGARGSGCSHTAFRAARCKPRGGGCPRGGCGSDLSRRHSSFLPPLLCNHVTYNLISYLLLLGVESSHRCVFGYLI